MKINRTKTYIPEIITLSIIALFVLVIFIRIN